ncbi:hypothetical protein [Treponema primitia]|uniref:hypothetical protein n=1 Tax=Treponema primitia TaxID=88058 RepID=UPI0002554FBC|nr:hypothetical protein [Treponema primitia]
MAENWQDTLYTKTFDQEVLGLERRRAVDPSCTIADVDGILQGLYVQDGADWLGRGEVGDITMAATIAAYEHIIAEWSATLPRELPTKR